MRYFVSGLKRLRLGDVRVSWPEDTEMAVVAWNDAQNSRFMAPGELSFEISHEITDEGLFVSI